MMFRLLSIAFLFLVGCVGVDQPDPKETIAAYEVPLHSAEAREEFLATLDKEARRFEFHVDSSTPEELEMLSSVSPITLNASVWRGDDDDEMLASAMDFQDRIGRVWIAFFKSEDAALSERFMQEVVSALKDRWPETRQLPIMPSGAIPHVEDLIVNGDRYVVAPEAAEKYAVLNE